MSLVWQVDVTAEPRNQDVKNEALTGAPNEEFSLQKAEEYFFQRKEELRQKLDDERNAKRKENRISKHHSVLEKLTRRRFLISSAEFRLLSKEKKLTLDNLIAQSAKRSVRTFWAANAVAGGIIAITASLLHPAILLAFVGQAYVNIILAVDSDNPVRENFTFLKTRDAWLKAHAEEFPLNKEEDEKKDNDHQEQQKEVKHEGGGDHVAC